MAIQMLAAWNGYEQHAVYTLSNAEETRLIGLGLARAYSGGVVQKSVRGDAVVFSDGTLGYRDDSVGGTGSTVSAGGAASSVGYDIVVLWGQSNIAGRHSINAEQDAFDGTVWQYGSNSSDAATYQRIVRAVEPLRHPDATTINGSTPRTSAAAYFAKSYSKLLPNGRILLVVPVAVGGTSIVGGTPTWQVGGTNYAAAVARVNEAVAAAQLVYESSRVVGFVCGIGDTDADNAVSSAAFQSGFAATLAGLRSAITGASDAWCVMLGLCPEGIANVSGYATIDAAHRALAGTQSKFVLVPGAAGYTSDNVHYTVRPGLPIMGSALADAARQLSAGGESGIYTPRYATTVGGTAPAQVTGLTLGTPTSSTQPLSWAAVSGATDYVIEYKAVASGTWLTFADGTSTATTTTVTGLSAATSYDYRVKAVNGAGTGTASATVTGSTTSAGAITYTFEGDTVGSAPANVSTLSGSGLVVANTGATALTGKYARPSNTASVAQAEVYSFANLVPSSATQTVTWRRERIETGTKDGMILRGQSGGTVTGYTGMVPGYLFQVRGNDGTLKILKVDAAGALTELASGAASVGTNTYYRASINGTTLTFEHSADGASWTTVCSANDSTFADGRAAIQYCTGFASTPNNNVIDDVALS